MRVRRLLYAGFTVLAFFALVELALWLAGVATLYAERDPFLGFSRRVRVFELDAERGRWYTPARAVDHSFNYQEFSAHKPDGALRVIVLGGSSAYGFPWNAASAFPRFLEQGLRAVHPGRPIEVVNAAAMSYGSHRLRILAHEMLRHEPDLLVVYGGHNEFIERRFYRDRLQRPAAADPLRLALSRWRLYSFLARGYSRISPEAPGPAQERTTAELLGLDVDRENAVDVDDRERAAVRLLFEENLRAIVELAERAGVPVVLCTVPSNIQGWRPNQSRFAPEQALHARREVEATLERARGLAARGRVADALPDLLAAVRAAPGFADGHFLLGRAQEARADLPAAYDAYTRARDLDAKPTRAPSSFNEAIRALASEHAGRVLLVDVERLLEAEAPGRLLGFNVFQDYVHPTPATHRLIAHMIWRRLVEEGPLEPGASPDDVAFWRALALDGPPRIGLEGHLPSPQADARTPALMFNLAVVLENHGLIDQAIEKYRLCRDMDPRYFVEAASNLARLLSLQRRFEEAVREHRSVLEVAPDHLKSLVGLGEALRHLGRPHEALVPLGRAVQIDAGFAPAWNRLCVSLCEAGRLADAEPPCRRALDLEPDNGDFRVDLGYALLLAGDVESAGWEFDRALAAGGDALRVRNGQAAVLVERGRLDDAERLFRQNLRAEPANAFARNGLEVIARRRAASR